MGLGNARNTAVSVATSEWILPLDDDDYILDNTANKLKEFICQNLDSHVIHHTIKDIIEDGRELLWGDKEIIFDKLLLQNQLPGTSLFKKAIWNEIGGYSNVVHPDWNFWIRIFKHKGKFTYFPEIFYYRERQNNSLGAKSEIKNQKKSFSLKVCKTIDVYGWAFHFIAQEMKKY
jgi:glycosyltransferase involved in cell wall biosynthesis